MTDTLHDVAAGCQIGCPRMPGIAFASSVMCESIASHPALGLSAAGAEDVAGILFARK